MSGIKLDVGLTLGRDYSSLLAAAAAERDVARAFASAANCGTSASLAGGAITVCLRFPGLKDDRRGGVRDACLLCVDRALTRVSPPLDPLQYLTASSPVFTPDPVMLVFEVQPSRAFTQEYPWKDTRSNAETGDNAVDHHRVDGTVVTAADVLAEHPTNSASAHGRSEESETPLSSSYVVRAFASVEARREAREATEATDALWEAAVTNKFSQLSGEGVAKARRFQWRLAYWCAERFINEASWAKLASPATKSGRLTTFAPVHKTVLDAAQAASDTSASSPSSTSSTSLSRYPKPPKVDPVRLVIPRVTHADVRGIEFDGLIVAHTLRYAYIAVPYVLNMPATGERRILWTLVSRVPVPAFLDISSRTEAGADSQDTSTSERKRSRSAPAGTHFYNTTEALLHDQQVHFTELPNSAKRAVTLCVHRAHCKASRQPLEPLELEGDDEPGRKTSNATTMPLPPTCPLRLSLWLEDAAVVASQSEVWTHEAVTSPLTLPDKLPVRPAGESTNEDPGNAPTHRIPPFTGLNTFTDLLGALSESCARYVQNGTKFIAASQDPVATAPSAPSPPVTAEATQTEETAPDAETGSVGSTTAAAGDNEEKVEPTLEAPSAPVLSKEETDESAWRRTAVRKALTLFASLTDTTSVHFKKLRRHQLPPGTMRSPTVDRWDDARGLAESCNVEFKYRLTESGAVSTANVDRIRHTLAAMASTQGGVVLVGVTDRGELVGHQRGAVMSNLRTTGFCPAMVKDSVVVKELRPPLARAASTPQRAAPGAGNTAAAAASKKAMPANWWKSAKSASTSESDDTAALKEAPKGGSQKTDRAAANDVVITAINVQRGQAPFYTAARNVAPYIRTCASSTLMPVHTMALRILNQLS